MKDNFLIINCIGNDDKLGLRINKEFFIHYLEVKNKNDKLVSEISNFLKAHHVNMDKISTNCKPGSVVFRSKDLTTMPVQNCKKVKLFGYKNSDLKVFNQKNIEKLFEKNLIEKKLINLSI